MHVPHIPLRQENGGDKPLCSANSSNECAFSFHSKLQSEWVNVTLCIACLVRLFNARRASMATHVGEHMHGATLVADHEQRQRTSLQDVRDS